MLRAFIKILSTILKSNRKIVYDYYKDEEVY
jgi:hypothetical protein